MSRYTRTDTVQPNILVCSFGTCKQYSCACLPFSKLSLQAQLPVMEALVPWFLPHTHDDDMPCMSTTLDVLSLVSACCLLQDFLHPLRAGKKRKTFTPCILQSAFSLPKQPLCRDNAPTLRSLDKISLSHILFAIIKELLGSGPPRVFCGKITVRGTPLCLVLLGNDIPVPCRILRKPVFSKDGYV